MKKSVLSTCAMLLALTACGSSNNEHGQGGAGGASGFGTGGSGAGSCVDPPDSSGAAEKLASAVCEPARDCCTAAGLDLSPASCAARVTGYFRSFIDDALCKGHTLKTAAVEECAAAIRSDVAACSREFSNDVALACRNITQGPTNPGAPCNSDLECHADANQVAVCESPATGAAPTCEVRNIVGEAQDCLPDYCERGLVCGNGTCAKVVGLGESCVSDATYCARDLTCAAGVCSARKSAGETCGRWSECQSDNCLPAGVCGGLPGSACTTDTDCRWGCVGGRCASDLSEFAVLAGVSCETKM